MNIQHQQNDWINQQNDWIIGQINDLTDSKNTNLVSECAESLRKLPKGSPFPGAWRNDRTPYLVEPMDSFSEHSDVEVEVWLKGHQLGFTAGIENVILYIITNAPGPILYSTASNDLGKEWSENRFDPMIQECALDHLIFSQTIKKSNKKTGDKTLLKEFPGGRIKISGYGSTAAFKSSSYRYFFGDEIDEALRDLKKQGNALEQAEARTSAYKTRRKICLFSTPVEEDQSNVNKAYLLGDQRKYFVPCPYCGFKQELQFKNIKYKRDKDGILNHDSVKLECQNSKCGKFIKNHHKADMYSSGRCEWRPTAKAKRQNYISRQMSCLYSPVGMITWSDVVQKYLDALDSGDPGKMKTFETLYLGQPYKELGDAPEFSKVITHRSNYVSKTIPEDVIYLTMSGDVQGDRVELEILGHGRNYRTYSIEYQVIKGETEDPNSGSWAEFRKRFMDGDYIYERKGEKFAPQLGFIDSNYRGSVVQAFCETCPGLHPIIGQDKFATPQKRFEIKNIDGSSLMMIRIATNYYKDKVYASLQIDRPLKGEIIPPGYPSFPYDYEDSYFKMLNAEYKRSKRIGDKVSYEYYCPKGRRNEALDVRVYNLCAAEVIYFMTMKHVLKKAIEDYQIKVGRPASVSEKMEFFYNHMENFGKLSI